MTYNECIESIWLDVYWNSGRRKKLPTNESDFETAFILLNKIFVLSGINMKIDYPLKLQFLGIHSAMPLYNSTSGGRSAPQRYMCISLELDSKQASNMNTSMMLQI